jgi:tetratricopeptide (TPR) repeat protein
VKKRWLVVPLLLSAAVYAPAPWGELVWDDQLFLASSHLVGFETVRDALFPPPDIPRKQWEKLYYRPVMTLSHMLDSRLFGFQSIAGPHVSNVIFHVIATFFVWVLSRRIFARLPNNEAGALAAATIFAVHPIHTESVSWIIGRGDVLATLFLLPSLILALDWRDRGAIWAPILGSIFFLLGLLAKEVAISGLMIIPALLLLVRANPSVVTGNVLPPRGAAAGLWPMIRTWAPLALAYGAAAWLYLALRANAGSVSASSVLPVPSIELLLNLARAFAAYCKKVLIPWPQSIVITWDMLPSAALSVIVVLVTVSILVYSIRRRQLRDSQLPLAMLIFLFALAPSLLVALGDDSRAYAGSRGVFPVAERYLYLPSIGVALLFGIAFCISYSTKWRRYAILGLGLLVAVYAVGTVDRGITWTSNLRLWADTVKKAGNTGLPWNALGQAYYVDANYDKALQAWRRGLEVSPEPERRALINYNMGLVYYSRRELKQAEQYFRRALEESDRYPGPYHGLGLVFTNHAQRADGLANGRQQRDDYIEIAIRNFQQALILDSERHSTRLYLAYVLNTHGQLLEGDGILDLALARYRSAQREMTTLFARIAPSMRAGYFEFLQAETGIDPMQMQRRVVNDLRRAQLDADRLTNSL